MSTMYQQKCVIGFKLTPEDYRVEISPRVVEKVPRYDIKTGQLSGYIEEVTKEAVYKYTYEDMEFDHPYYLKKAMVSRKDINAYIDNFNSNDACVYVGENIEIQENGEFLEGCVDLEKISEIKKEMISKFPDRDIKLHFYVEIW